jgi:hypothetical protein
LRPTLQRWPGANRPIVEGFGVIPGKPVVSVDGLRPPSLTTGAAATSVPSISRLMAFITPVSSLTNSCPEKPGAAQRQRLRRQCHTSAGRRARHDAQHPAQGQSQRENPLLAVPISQAIERMFCRLKDFKRVATGYDRNAVNFLAAVCIEAAVSYWL